MTQDLTYKKFLSDLRLNKTIKFLKKNGKINFFKINKHLQSNLNYNYKEYELWWIYSMNSYFNIIRKRWKEYMDDEYTISWKQDQNSIFKEIYEKY